MDAKIHRQLANLEVAEMALRQNLHGHVQDATTRSVNQLVRELTGMERFFESLQIQTDGPLRRS